MKSYGSGYNAGDEEDRGLLVPSRVKIVEAVDHVSEQNGYVFCCVPWNWISNSGDDPMIGNMSSVILLLNSMIGSGILVQGYVFKESGIINAIVVYIIIACMTYTGIDLLISSADLLQVFDYSQLAVATLGNAGGKILDFSIAVGNAGALLSYMLIIGTLTSDILSGLFGTSWFTSTYFMTILLSTAVILPSCLIRKFGHLAYISYISIFAIAGTMMLVCIYGPLESYKYDSDKLTWSTSGGTLKVIGSVVFAFGFASSVFHTYVALDDSKRSPSNFNVLTSTTILLGVTMCFLTGFIGYISFRSSTEADILENFDGTLGAVFKIAVIVHLLLYIPGDFVVMRYSLFRLFGTSVQNTSDYVYIITTNLMLFTVTISACLLNQYASSSQSLTIILDITGGICFSIVNFILPGLFAVTQLQDDPSKYTKGVVLTMLGFCIPILVIFSTIFELL